MTSQFSKQLSIAGLAFTVIATWLLEHPYVGLGNTDATLYSLMALARLHPLSLPWDVFLRLGTQDSYTLYSPLLAAVLRGFDLEPAAASLTFLAQVLLFGGAWLFARTVMSARAALLAVGLLIALPSGYGAGDFFHYLESFLTPRLWAEAATLFALAAYLRGRYATAAICLLLGMSLHPLMTLAGLVMLACLIVVLPRPALALGLGACAVLLSLIPIVIHPMGVFAPFDPDWLSQSVSGASYLMLHLWHLQDWARLTLWISVLIVGATTNTAPRVRELCLAALLTAACGIAVNGFYGDILHSVIFTQLQPWRWLWLVEATTALLLPVIVADCWQSGASGRAAILLLASVWMLAINIADPYFAWIAIVLPIGAVAATRATDPRVGSRLLLAAGLLLACALTLNVAFKLVDVPTDPAATGAPVLNSDGAGVWFGDGVPCVLALLLAWWVAGAEPDRAAGCLRSMSLCAVAAAACIGLTPLAWQSWTCFDYPSRFRALVAPWRALLPQRAQGIWPQTPLGAWYLLQRASYYSPIQAAGDVFSRTKAMEIHRRAQLIRSVLKASSAAQTGDAVILGADDLNTQELVKLCESSELDFYVSWSRLELPSAGDIAPNPARPQQQLHLYRCTDIKKARG